MSAKYDFVHCPICGKELINLCWYPGDLNRHHYWCDDCNIDIDIEVGEEEDK